MLEKRYEKSAVRHRAIFAITLVCVLTALFAGSQAAFAQAQYPSRTIRVISPFPPGGFSDLAARAIALGLQQEFGSTVVVENRPGAGGLLATEIVFNSPADGYTLLLASNTGLAILPHLVTGLKYDLVKDFAPVSVVSMATNVLVIRPGLETPTVKDLIALAKSRPGALNFGSSGIGTPQHMIGEMFQSSAGVSMVHIPYKGTVAGLQEVMAGRLDLMFADLPSAAGLVKSGKLKTLAVSTATRAPFLPDVPTIAESGLPGFSASTWVGIVVRAQTPPEIVQRLSRAIVTSLARPEIRNGLVSLGAEPGGTPPERFAALISEDGQRWGKIIRDAGIKLEP
jgi:tripartite-type tricarboxylate transporter receptor subunit TctC